MTQQRYHKVQAGFSASYGAHDPPTEPGYYIGEIDGLLYTLETGGTLQRLSAGGGSQPGVAIVRKFPFTFATAGLATGATVYTPTIGDILLDGWIEIDTAWDGTTPLCDFGTFDNGHGWLRTGANNPVDASGVDGRVWDTTPSLISQGNLGSGHQSSLSLSFIASWASSLAGITRGLPAKWVTATPVKVCVSQDGTDSGGSPGASQGAGILYLVTATPT